MTIEAIETAAAIAWPAKESAVFGAWRAFAGGGFSRRRNSVVPEGPVPVDLDRHLADVDEWYRARSLPTLFRINPLCDPAVDGALADLGFSIEAPTLVMRRSIEAGQTVAGVVESRIATDSWISVHVDALGIEASMIVPWLATIAGVPSPAVFVSPVVEDSPVGGGLGVAVGAYFGVFEVVVDPAHRRRGHATRMMAALHAFGSRAGASTAFLQVLEDDDRAIALYRSLGYDVSHHYWYRRLA